MTSYIIHDVVRSNIHNQRVKNFCSQILKRFKT